jgi:ligand-binding sensor domain-containing protein
VVRISGGKAAVYERSDGLTDSRALAVFEDREGSIWVGTAGGLDRFRDTKFTTLTMEEGLPSNPISAVMESRDGTMWAFCPGGGLARIRDGRVSYLAKKDGLKNLYATALLEGKDGSLLLGTGDGGSGICARRSHASTADCAEPGGELHQVYGSG